MQVLHNSPIGIDQGSKLLFSDCENDGEMWAGNGDRCRRVPVRFSTRYKSAPAVQVSVDMWDMDICANQRANISADRITREGFDIVFKTWGDTRVARVSARWLALGAVASEDDWDV